MGEIAIYPELLKMRLTDLGLERIAILSLGEETDDCGRPNIQRINGFISSLDFNLQLDPISDWRRVIGKFYENTKYHDEADWRARELQKLFNSENIMSYFMKGEPSLRLSNEDRLTIVRSVLEHITEITSGGIQINYIGRNKYNPAVIEEAGHITRDVPFQPYVIGKDYYIRK